MNAVLQPGVNATAPASVDFLERRLIDLVASCPDAEVLRGPLCRQIADAAFGRPALIDKLAAAIDARYAALVNKRGLWKAVDIKRALQAAAAPALELTNYSVADAVLSSVRDRGDDLMAVPQEDGVRWYQWHSTTWTPAVRTKIATVVNSEMKRMADGLGDSQSDDRKAAAAMLGSKAFEKGVLGSLESTAELHVDAHELDARGEFLTVGNGAVNLRTGELVVDRTLRLTVRNEVVYKPDAACPQFMKVLGQVFPEGSAERDFYELAMGYSLTAYPVERAVFFHWGGGSNGKSVLMGAIQRALGDNALVCSEKLVAAPANEIGTDANAATPALYAMKDKRLAYVEELSTGLVLRDALVKQLAGGPGMLPVRAMRAEQESIRNTSVLHVNCNNFAVVRGGQDALWQRIYPIVYTWVCPDDEKDVLLDRKLAAEVQGVLAWAVRCAGKYLRFQDEGKALRTALPPSSWEKLEKFKVEQNPFAEWVEERCEVSQRGFIPTREALASYNAFVRSVNPNSKAVYSSARTFLTRMTAEHMGQHREQVVTEQQPKMRQNGFVGLTLKESPQWAKNASLFG